MQSQTTEEGDSGVCHRLFSWVLGRVVGFWRHAPSSHHHPLPPVSGSEVPVEYTNGGPEKDQSSIAVGKSSGDQLRPDGGGRRPVRGKEGKVRVTIEEGEGRKERPWPRLTLVTNINEKSGDFIRERKEAMQRTNTMNINSTDQVGLL